jgi:hypothetical protein
MIKPGQQIDEYLQTLDAKCIALGVRIAGFEKQLASADDDTVDIEAPDAPSPDPVAFDFSGVPSLVEVGDVIEVRVTGLADGSEVWVHWFDRQWGDLHDESDRVDAGFVAFEVPEKLGGRILQLQVPDGPKGDTAVTVKVAEDNDPVPAPSSQGTVITTGAGWTRNTPVPPQIGSVTEPAIAHWSVVPEQRISGRFTVGVIAYHLDGIDRVEISANNGPWVRIDEPSINPRTRQEEYWTDLFVGDTTGTVDLRAIAYPKKGKPVLVKPLGTTYGQEDLTLYAGDFPVQLIELDAGRHVIKAQDMPKQGWLVIRPKPRIHLKDCIVTAPPEDKSRWGKGRVKFEGLAVDVPEGNGIFRGRYDRDDRGRYFGNHIWFDRCIVTGAELPKASSYITVGWETCTYTGCDISRFQNVFHSHGATKLFSRGNLIHDVYEDIYRASGLMTGDTIRNVDRTAMLEAQNLTGTKRPHPDIWQFQNLPGTIAQDITAVDNINAQGLFPADFSDSAFVRVRVKSVSPYGELQMQGETRNVLLKDCDFDGTARLREDKGFRVPAGERFVFDGTKGPDNPPDGVEVR